MTRFSALICGGGIAGIEAVLRLRRLAGDRLDITVISPSDHLVYRPLAVLEPFGAGRPRRYPVERIVADTGVRWVRDTVGWVDRADRTVHTAGGQPLRNDALLLAVAGRQVAPRDGSFVFSDRTASEYRAIAERAAAGAIAGLLFTEPKGPAWPLSLYELALLTAAGARSGGRRPELALCEPGGRPSTTRSWRRISARISLGSMRAWPAANRPRPTRAPPGRRHRVAHCRASRPTLQSAVPAATAHGRPAHR